MTMQATQWETHPEHFWLRGQSPEKLVELDETTGIWNIYGYPECVAALSDPATFSNDVGRLFPVSYDPSLDAGDFTQMDPPEHRKFRGLVNHAFTPNLVSGLQRRVAELTHELLDEHIARGRFEFVSDFAFALPVVMIAELLGVPGSDRYLFRQWMEKMLEDAFGFRPMDEEVEAQQALEKGLAQLQEMRSYWLEHAEERKRKPREDLLSQLVQVEVDGERLNDIEVFNIANRLFIAGHHTTTMLLTNTMMCLDAFPEQAAQVRADRSLMPTLVEESLRFLSPISSVMRATMTDVEVAGQVIPKDQAVNIWNGAANRDEREFADPHAFDPGRSPNPHIGFGRGVHFCVGRRLARMEGKVVLNILLDRLPNFRVDPDNPPKFFDVADAAGASKLHVLVD